MSEGVRACCAPEQTAADALLYNPGSHGVGAAAAAPQAEPAGQGVQAAAAPVAYVPAPHAVQRSAPPAAAVPAAQGFMVSIVVLDVAHEYPARHGLHAVAEALL
jgi:hypothetical protein